jgi:ParB-like chromosome segregation protein Spo0J
MQKNEQTTLLLDIAVQNKEIVYQENKTLAKFSWLRRWEKNPRTVSEKNLKKLEKQIEQLGIYKPFVVALEGDYGTILGGNQRYLAIQSLSKKNPKKYEYVPVSIVNADNDVDKIKFALSDNFSAGEYSREKLKEIINLEQGNLFTNYDISFEDKKTIEEFIGELALTENELRFKGIKKDLKTLGINEETISVLSEMVGANKINEELADVDIKGCLTGQKLPLMFWVEDPILYEQLQIIFSTGFKDKYSIEKLLEFTQKFLGKKLPTTEIEFKKVMKKIEELNKRMLDYKELGEDGKKLKEEKAKVEEKLKKLFYGLSPKEKYEI